MSRATGAAAAIALLLSSSTSRAQVVGDRAVGMGGAYTALADDPSAIWYNPAGLVHVPGPLLSASASLYTYRQLREPGFVAFDAPRGSGRAVLREADFTSTSVVTFPSTLAYALGWDLAAVRVAAGLAVLVPHSDKSTGTVSLDVTQVDQAAFRTTFETREDTHDYFFGPAMAVGGESWSAGASVLVRYFDRDYSYNYFGSFHIPSEPNDFVSAYVFTEEYRSWSLVPALGLQLRPVGGWRLGLYASAPSMTLGGRVKMTRVVTQAGSELHVDATNPSDSHTQSTIGGEGDTIMKLPWVIRGGVGYERVGSFAAELSLQYETRIGAYLDRDPPLPNSTESEHNLLSSKGGFNANLGLELSLTPSLQARLGLYTLLLHHPPLPPASQVSGNSAAGDHYEDGVGANVALGTGSPGGTRTSFGINVVRGFGHALGFLTGIPDYPTGPKVGDPLHIKTVRTVDSTFWQVAFVTSGTIGTQ